MSKQSTHLIPAIVSFFLPGIGQILKGQIFKGIGIVIAGVIIGVFLSWTIIVPILVWAWNVYDAYAD